jgi:hypothetical protein
VEQLRGDLDLAQEAVGAEPSGELRPQHPHPHAAAVSQVVGKVHRGHAAAPELAPEAVPLRQGALQLAARRRRFHALHPE